MRAHEFLENLDPAGKPITLRHLHQMKLRHQRHQAAEEERQALMAIMYADPAEQQAQIDLERERLELEKLRAEIAAIKSDAKNKSATALHNNAKSGIKAAQKTRQQLTKQAKQGLGRGLKT